MRKGLNYGADWLINKIQTDGLLQNTLTSTFECNSEKQEKEYPDLQASIHEKTFLCNLQGKVLE
ncbi:MAG: hypothetical protein HKN16_07700 [Saprospiraceae bacterium]|nr:hypothetical protein [Saprospiraceae bacterium]